MPEIRRSRRTIAFDSGTRVRTVAPVEVDTSLESAVGVLGKTIEDIAVRQQNEEDINSLYEAETSYKEQLIPVLQGERERQGSDTKDNIERVNQSSQDFRNSVLEKAHPRVRGRLNAKLDRVDLGNEAELSRLRSAGIKVEREQQEDRQIANAKETVLETPLRAIEEMDSLQNMYDDKVDAGIYTEEEADLKVEAAANELAITAITAIGEQQGPTAQLGLLTSGAFDEFISADQKEKFITEAQKLEKAVDKQNQVDVDTAQKEADQALVDSQDAYEDDFFKRWDDPENPTTLPEIQQSNLSVDDKIKWAGHVEKNAKNELLTTDWTLYNDINNQLYTEEIANWTPAKINAEVKKGGLAIGGKGSEAGAAELISTYKSNTKATSDKDPKLGVILKQVDSLSKNLIFEPTFTGGTPTNEQDINNAVRHANVTQAIIDRVDKGEDPAVAFEAEMKPYMDEQSKSLLDGFVETLGFFAGVPQRKFISGLLGAEEPDNQPAIDFLSRNKIPITDANIKLANERLK